MLNLMLGKRWCKVLVIKWVDEWCKIFKVFLWLGVMILSELFFVIGWFKLIKILLNLLVKVFLVKLLLIFLVILNVVILELNGLIVLFGKVMWIDIIKFFFFNFFDLKCFIVFLFFIMKWNSYLFFLLKNKKF